MPAVQFGFGITAVDLPAFESQAHTHVATQARRQASDDLLQPHVAVRKRVADDLVARKTRQIQESAQGHGIVERQGSGQGAGAADPPVEYVVAEVLCRPQIEIGLVVAAPGRVKVATVRTPATRRIVQVIELVEVHLGQEATIGFAAAASGGGSDGQFGAAVTFRPADRHRPPQADIDPGHQVERRLINLVFSHPFVVLIDIERDTEEGKFGLQEEAALGVERLIELRKHRIFVAELHPGQPLAAQTVDQRLLVSDPQVVSRRAAGNRIQVEAETQVIRPELLFHGGHAEDIAVACGQQREVHVVVQPVAVDKAHVLVDPADIHWSTLIMLQIAIRVGGVDTLQAGNPDFVHHRQLATHRSHGRQPILILLFADTQ